MNLGTQLKQAQAFHDEAERRTELAARAAAEEESLKRSLSARHFFDYAFQLFELRLRHGNLPGVISLGGKTFNAAANALDTYKWSILTRQASVWRTEGKGVWTPDHALHQVWQEFDERCKAAGLAPMWTYAYNGDVSWYDLTVVAAS